MLLPFSIIIPAYNEATRLGKTLGTVFAYLNETSPQSEVIVVDDGSTDQTVEVAEQSFLTAGKQITTRLFRSAENKGKGHAVRVGLLAARHPVALFSDADLSTPITETPKVVAPIQSGEYDLIFGSRALDRSLIGVHQPWRREQGGRIFNLLVGLATRLPFWDTQCGFKAFRMSVCRPIVEAAQIDRFGFDVELLYVAHIAGLRLREWPVRWDHNEGSKVDVARDSLRMFNEVRVIRRAARRGVYRDAIRQAREQMVVEREKYRSGENVDLTESDASEELARTRC